jgi:putative PIN family toxin of toxin-antitoxin system
MFDTNILLSAALFPNARIDGIVEYIVRNHTLILSDFVIEEFLEVADYDKFRRVPEAREFLRKLSFATYKTPKVSLLENISIRDDEDYDILFSAVKSKVDIFLTRDKDFLECGVSRPRMMTLNNFEAEFMRNATLAYVKPGEPA